MTSSVPYHHSWGRNIANVLIYHIVLLYIHYVSNTTPLHFAFTLEGRPDVTSYLITDLDERKCTLQSIQNVEKAHNLQF
jgi:hypothetical protein